MGVNDKTVLYALSIGVSLRRLACTVKVKDHGIYSVSVSRSLSSDKRDLCRHPSTTAAKALRKQRLEQPDIVDWASVQKQNSGLSRLTGSLP